MDAVRFHRSVARKQISYTINGFRYQLTNLPFDWVIDACPECDGSLSILKPTHKL